MDRTRSRVTFLIAPCDARAGRPHGHVRSSVLLCIMLAPLIFQGLPYELTEIYKAEPSQSPMAGSAVCNPS
jgi:hypothetical protein